MMNSDRMRFARLRGWLNRPRVRKTGRFLALTLLALACLATLYATAAWLAFEHYDDLVRLNVFVEQHQLSWTLFRFLVIAAMFGFWNRWVSALARWRRWSDEQIYRVLTLRWPMLAAVASMEILTGFALYLRAT